MRLDILELFAEAQGNGRAAIREYCAAAGTQAGCRWRRPEYDEVNAQRKRRANRRAMLQQAHAAGCGR